MKGGRVYYVTGFMNSSHKVYDNLEEAVNACKKYNKRAKNKRRVMSGIPVIGRNNCYTDTRTEYKED